jgi:hypothetical protein
MNQPTDKELLELAARAVGYDISHPMNKERQEMNPPVLGFVTYLGGNLQCTLWNPLDDDGQALRLAVKLKVDVIPKWGDNCVCVIGGGDHFEESQETGMYAAMRRAIVRAAAEIGAKL